MASESVPSGEEESLGNDAADVQAYLAGPETEEGLAAINRLLARYRPILFAWAMRIAGNVDIAEDAVQNTLLQVVLKIGTVRNPAAMSGWLRVTLRHITLNMLTRSRPTLSLDGDHAEELADGRQEEAITAEERTEISALLDRLRPLDRSVLQAFYIDGLSIREAAALLQVPLGTIKRRLHVARHRFRVLLSVHPLFAEVV